MCYFSAYVEYQALLYCCYLVTHDCAAFSVFTENMPVVSASAVVCTDVNEVNSGNSDNAASQNYMHRSLVNSQATRQTFDARGTCQRSVPGSRRMLATSVCDVNAEQQRQHSTSDDISKIFQTSDLELTDADLEFNLK